MGIEVRSLTKVFGHVAALQDVSFTVGTGELFALLGPSGSGKTTLLRIIAGLEAPDGGTVLLDGKDATSTNARDRAVGFVFQHYALFRHMTAFDNVAFGMRVRPRNHRLPGAAISAKVRELLALVQLDHLADRYPSQLSGGQRQRVALARALAVEPRVLLLDEPFGALDARVREELRQWLRRLHEEIRLTSVFVTHDQEEAFELAERVVILNNGRIEQQGRSDEVLDNPANPFVLRFLGHANEFRGRLANGRAHFDGFAVDLPRHTDSDSRAVSGYAWPHELEVSRAPTGGGVWTTVEEVRRSGGVVKLELRSVADDRCVRVELAREEQQRLAVRTGERVYITPRQVRVFVED